MTVIQFPNKKGSDELTEEEIRRINAALDVCEGTPTEIIENLKIGSLTTLFTIYYFITDKFREDVFVGKE